MPQPKRKILKQFQGPAEARSAAVARIAARRTMGNGTIFFPCIPSLADVYARKLVAIWQALGRAFSEPEQTQLATTLARALDKGFAVSPHAQVIVTYDVHPPPKGTLDYNVRVRERSVEEYYSEWSGKDGGAWFGGHADAKVLELAGKLPARAHVLDVGAGHGRNALPLCRLGFRVDALELAPALCESMRAATHKEALALEIIQSDMLADDLKLAPDRYALILVSEVMSHLRDVGQVRRALTPLSAATAADGCIVLNAFLAKDGYAPENLVREAAQVALSSTFTRPELAAIAGELGIELVSDESAAQYEREHLPAAAWPPTPWFESWAQGRNIFDLVAAQSPIELRWLVYRKRAPASE